MEQQQTELTQETANTLPPAQPQPVGQQPYHTPTFVCYGELAALVQGQPGSGFDGGGIDCSLGS